MASFKNLIFIALVVYAVAAEEAKPAGDGTRVKKEAFIAAVPAPALAYSASAPGSFSYGYSTYGAYPYAYPAAAYPAAAYPAPLPYAAKAAYAAYPAYPAYAEDDGSYWPGKYEKTYVPAAYPTAYHY